MRLKEDDTSWKSGGIKRRMYRQAPLTPEEEVPRRGFTDKKYKKRHVHTYESRHLGTQTVRRRVRKWDGSGYEIREYDEPKTIYVCTGCGNKRSSYYWGW